jgi:hypothetical protein
MERTVRVYARGREVLLCDSEYCWDISEILAGRYRRKAEEMVGGSRPETHYDLILCGELRVQVDAVKFLTYVLNREIQSKVDVQRELGKVIVELEGRTLDRATDEEILTEAGRRSLHLRKP